MEIIGRDKITQKGNNATVKIDNRQSKAKVHRHQTWLGVLLLIIIGGIVVGLSLYFTGTN